MRTNIVIDKELMDAALRAGPFKTKREAVEAGLKLLARQSAYRDILALRGQLLWEDAPRVASAVVAEPRVAYTARRRRTAGRVKRAR
jgi:Arc/MetJ family transcription regulator